MMQAFSLAPSFLGEKIVGENGVIKELPIVPDFPWSFYLGGKNCIQSINQSISFISSQGHRY